MIETKDFGEIVKAVDNAQIVAIVGPPCSGKSTLCNKLLKSFFPKANFIHCDDFIGNDFHDSAIESLARVSESLAKHPSKKIILEGYSTSFMLRDGLKADCVIKMQTDQKVMNDRYLKRKNKPYPDFMAKATETVFNEYIQKSDALIFVVK